MAKAIYVNKNDTQVFIIKRDLKNPRHEMIQAQSIKSGQRTWYTKEEFDRQFRFSHVEYNAY